MEVKVFGSTFPFAKTEEFTISECAVAIINVDSGIVTVDPLITQSDKMTVVAEGTEKVLNNFLETLSVGPEEAEVDDVEVTWSMAFGGFEGFRVKLW